MVLVVQIGCGKVGVTVLLVVPDHSGHPYLVAQNIWLTYRTDAPRVSNRHLQTCTS